MLATLGLLMASLSVTHLGLMSRESNGAIAGDLARSVLALGIQRIFQDQTVGSPGNLTTLSLPPWEGPESCRGLLTFDPVVASNERIGCSLNNLDSGGSVLGAGGQVVPLHGVLLVAVGECNGVRREISAVINVPPFPYAIAADGPVESGGQLEVGAAEFSPPPATPVEDLDPAVLFSNSGITLGPNTTINGDLKSAGAIALDPGVNVTGLVQPNQERNAVPNVTLTQYDPEVTGQGYSPVDPGVPQLGGRNRFDGVLHYSGDLQLIGAVLFVNGDLQVDGSLSGTGLVVTTGSLTIAGQANMTSADQVALLSGGDMTLGGTGVGTSRLRGVVYCEGDLQASHLKLEGGLITRQRGATPPRMALDEVQVIGIGDLTRFSFPLGIAGAGSVGVAINNCGGCTDFPPPDTSMPEAFTSIVRMPNGTFGVGGHYTPSRLGFALNLVYESLPQVDAALRDDLRAQFGLDQHFVDPNGTSVSNDFDLTVDGLGNPPEQGPGYGEIITFDPSQLVAISESARVVYWKER